MLRSFIPIYILIAFICFPILSYSQTPTTHRQDSLATLLVERDKKLNAAKMTMAGYRIQIYFGSERAKAQEIKTDFGTYYPQTASYFIYHQPNFKIRVGDFRTRLAAEGFLKKIAEHYSTAFIVSDDVRLPDQ